jgi:Zn-dependent oligopeptidase
MSSLSLIILNYKDITIDQISAIKDDYITNLEKVNDNILNNPHAFLTWDNFIQPIIDFQNNYTNIAILNMKNFHPSEEIRAFCSEIDSELEQYNINNNMRKDIYNYYSFYYINTYPHESSKLTDEQKNFMIQIMLDFTKLGLGLEDESYNRVKEIKNELSELTSTYELNVDNYSKEFLFTQEQLEEAGLPQSFIDERKTDDGKIKISLQYPDYVPMMDYCKNREIRKQMNYEYKRKAYDTNVEIAEKVFKLRQEQAKLFGYENHSDYELNDSMAKSTENVMKFLDNLREKIKPLHERDYNLLLEYAKKDNITKLESYDISYYSNLLIEDITKLKKEDLKKYFPVQSTVTSVFKIYEQILDYKFIEITHLHLDTLWHEEVKLYEVRENDLIKGAFYIDLHPRDGKYGHAAVFPLITKSSQTLPIAAIACNFAKDFLNFDELETFFHEFGHVMHHISSKSTISETASFSCEGDFVETPSQMFEEWCYNNSILKILNEDKTITDDIIEKIKKQRNILQGWHVARQLLFCYIDMFLHSKKFISNSFEVVKRLTKEICNIDTIENTNELASFGHLMDGYDAGYYGYMWSLVYAKDLFTMFKDKELDQEIGKKFKEQILSQGSIRPSIESVKMFLNREPNLDAFINSII